MDVGYAEFMCLRQVAAVVMPTWNVGKVKAAWMGGSGVVLMNTCVVQFRWERDGCLKGGDDCLKGGAWVVVGEG